MSTIQIIELYFYCGDDDDDDDDDGPSMWIWWLSRWTLFQRAHAQPAASHMAWADGDFMKCWTLGLRRKNRNDYSSSRMSLRMVWLPRSHQRALNGKQGYIYMYSYEEGRLQNLTWKIKSTANCDVTVIKIVTWILSLACAAEPFINEVLLMLFWRPLYLNLWSTFVALFSLLTKRMWLLSKLVPEFISSWDHSKHRSFLGFPQTHHLHQRIPTFLGSWRITLAIFNGQNQSSGDRDVLSIFCQTLTASKMPTSVKPPVCTAGFLL